MKRSEMVKLIGKLLVFGVDGLPRDKKEEYKNLSLADVILSEIEEAGMVPPEIKQKAIDEKYGLSYTIRANKWEKE